VAYYRLENFWQDTQVYIHATDFDKLKPDQLVYIHILEQAGQIFKAFQTFGFLLKGPHLLENKGRDVQIETTEEIRETVIPQAPSYETRKIWDSQVQLLLEACNQGIKKAETRKSQDGQYLNTHLFVPYALAHQSLTSLDLVINDLTALKLDIQQTRHLYESLKTD
jgi:hypothetical protein